MNQNVFKKRIYFSIGLIILIVLFLIYKLFSLHFSSKIVIHDKKTPELRRGYIKDRNGYVLALSIETGSLFANPQEIADPAQTAQKLSAILNINSNRIVKKLKKRDKKFVWLKRRLEQETVKTVRRLKIKGLYFSKEYKRVYPNDHLASNIIGFVGVDNIGLEGIEYGYNEMLSGHDQVDTSQQDFISGKNVVLTIERYVQHLSEKALAAGVINANAKRGVVVVLEVKTGKILAYAKYPNFDPNNYSRYTQQEIRNYTFIDSFEPGSTMKMLSMVAILQHRPDLLKHTYQCKGFVNIYDTTIRCPHVHGTVDVNKIISESCNVGIIKMIENVKPDQLFDVYHKFGLGQRTGIELPGETDGILRPVREWSGLSKYSMSIGHEVSVTSIQLAAAFGAIANDGVYIVPTIIESIENSNGDKLSQYTLRSKGRVIKKTIARKLMKLMRGVVADGTGKLARADYFKVAGKTGTSEKYSRERRSYIEKVTSSFVGIAPYHAPKYCVLVIIDDPADNRSGGKVAAPVFRSVIDKLLLYGGVKDTAYKAEGPVNKSSLKAPDYNKMPDLRGKSLGEVVAVLHILQRKYNIRYTINGTGTIYDQRPLPGEKLSDNSTLEIYLK